MVSFPIVAFVVVKLKILNVFCIDSVSWGDFAPPFPPPPPPAPPPPPKKKEKRKENYLILQKITPNVECRIKIENSTLRIFEKFKFLQKQDVYTQSLYFWSFFDTPVSPLPLPQLKMAEIEKNNYFQRKNLVIKILSLVAFLGSRCILNLVH